MSLVFLEDNNSAPFAYDENSSRVFRVEPNRRVDVSEFISAAELRANSVRISEERAIAEAKRCLRCDLET